MYAGIGKFYKIGYVHWIGYGLICMAIAIKIAAEHPDSYGYDLLVDILCLIAMVAMAVGSKSLYG